MLDTGFADALHRSGLERRIRPLPDGDLAFALAQGGHVRVEPRAWRDALATMEDELRPVRRRTRRLAIAWFPGVLLFGMTLGQVLPLGGLVILLLIFGGPLFLYLQHSHAVQRAAAGVERSLSQGPVCPAPPRRSAPFPRWAEIAFLLLVGPDLLIGAAGELGGPDLFRGTPLWGAGLGIVEYAAAALIALRLCWPRVAKWWFARAHVSAIRAAE